MTKQYPSHTSHTVPSIIEWYGGTCCTNIQIESQKADRRHLGTETIQVIIHLQADTAHYNGKITRRINVGKTAKITTQAKITEEVEQKQFNQKLTHDKSSVIRDFQEGEEMYAKNFSAHGPQWLAGHITKLTGPVSVEIQLEDLSRIRRHFDQICKTSTTTENATSDLVENPEASAFVSYPPENLNSDSEMLTNHDVTPASANVTTSDPPTVPNLSTSNVPIRRNPVRNRKPSERLTY